MLIFSLHDCITSRFLTVLADKRERRLREDCQLECSARRPQAEKPRVQRKAQLFIAVLLREILSYLLFSPY